MIGGAAVGKRLTPHPIFLRVLAPHRGRKPRGARPFGSQGSRKPVFLRPAICDPKVKPRDTRALTLTSKCLQYAAAVSSAMLGGRMLECDCRSTLLRMRALALKKNGIAGR